MKKSTTKIIQKIQSILIENPNQSIVYASMKAGLELGYPIDEVKFALEEFRKAGF